MYSVNFCIWSVHAIAIQLKMKKKTSWNTSELSDFNSDVILYYVNEL